jgi:hypothetical protein
MSGSAGYCAAKDSPPSGSEPGRHQTIARLIAKKTHPEPLLVLSAPRRGSVFRRVGPAGVEALRRYCLGPPETALSYASDLSPRETEQFLGFYDVHADCLSGLFCRRKRVLDISKAFCSLRRCYPRKRLFVILDNLHNVHDHPCGACESTPSGHQRKLPGST